ncbi:hypothetical protein [Pedobacter miscanthi]|jgi:hypothetical protein|uniref:hypothetical protein n=1 Tax=Pedobacter miscanthi TaxID=2259170 RepID=UPI00292E5B02|nr:hypothetical protein [Pedobacter miscanthi]
MNMFKDFAPNGIYPCRLSILKDNLLHKIDINDRRVSSTKLMMVFRPDLRISPRVLDFYNVDG